MKMLYAIQGTGNGHITRAIEIIPILKRKGEVDILLSGTESTLTFPFDIKYRFKGLCFVFGKNGGVDMWHTYLKMNSVRFLREIRQLDVSKYDLVISDFEPVSCWACLFAKKPSVGLSNQVATLHPLAPRPKKRDPLGKAILSHYAPSTFNYGFHFKALDQNIFTPVIRRSIRNTEITNKGHYTVYLPAYNDERILHALKKFKRVKWEVFSKYAEKRVEEKNITIYPADKGKFIASMTSSAGILCNAGFGTASEALFLNKKLMVIPMKSQYEQQCNAAMLRSMGIPVIKKLKKKNFDKINDWLDSEETISVDYPDITEFILDTIIENHAGKSADISFEQEHYALFQ